MPYRGVVWRGGPFPEGVVEPPELRFEHECDECGELFGTDDPEAEDIGELDGSHFTCYECIRKEEHG